MSKKTLSFLRIGTHPEFRFYFKRQTTIQMRSLSSNFYLETTSGQETQ